MYRSTSDRHGCLAFDKVLENPTPGLHAKGFSCIIAPLVRTSSVPSFKLLAARRILGCYI